jgi:uncharacterized protein (DUF1697 family)
MKPYVILLRGVMPTGKNKVPMAQLRTALAAAGLLDVQTYIQSGNVIARSDLERLPLEQLVHDVIAREIGAEIAVIARTAEEYRRVLDANPFPQADTSRLYFSLLSAQPAQKLLDELLGIDFSPEEVKIIDDVIYTLYATKQSDSRFHNNFYESRLKVAITTRNFNTTARLVAMSSEYLR